MPSSASGVGGGAATGAAAGSMFGPWGTLIGAGLGAVGGMVSGGGNEGPSTQEREAAARANRYADEGDLYGGMARQLAVMFGPERARQVLQGTLSTDQFSRLFGRGPGAVDRTSVQAQMKAIEDRLAPYRASRGNKVDDRAAAAAGVNVQSELSRLRELQTMLTTGVDPGQTGSVDAAAFDKMGPGVMGKYNDLATEAAAQGKGALKSFGRDTQALIGQSRNIESGAADYGRSERERIAREADRALTGANRMTEAKMIGRGFGASTALTQGLTGNARSIMESKNDALGMLGDKQMEMLNRLRGNTLSLAGQRLGQGTQLSLGNQDRTLGFKQQALGVETNALTNPTMNPFYSRSAASSGYSAGLAPAQPSQSAQWGNWLSGLGGQVFNLGAMDWLKNLGVGGSGGSGG